jgi:hypothetical protein
MKNLVVVLMGDSKVQTIEVNHNDQVEVLCLDLRNGMSNMSTNDAASAYEKMTKAVPDNDDSDFNKDLWKATLINLMHRYRQSLRAKFPRSDWVKAASADITSLGYGDWIKEQIHRSKASFAIIEEGLKEV